ncbi:MAG: DUF58 domain-containing protein [Planctomycetaceae bacterium]|nr:DUF58 domain-containing protein [Planctomycetaceae bacterium]
MSRKPRISITHEGWYYLVLLGFLLIGAMLREINLLLLLTALLAGPLLLCWRLVWITLRSLKIRRKMPHGVCAGDLLVVNLEISNARRKTTSWALVAEEQIVRINGTRDAPVKPAVFFSHVKPGQTRRREYRGRLPQRGRYRVGPLKVSTRFPFGLFCGIVTFDQVDTLTVYPRLGRLTAAWRSRHRESLEGTQRRKQGHARMSGDFYGVREWQNGDSRRWIHWRSSARHNTLVVRQFEQQRHRDIAVLVDLWIPKRANTAQRENVELAVSFAATIVAEACRHGGSNLLTAVGTDTIRLAGGATSPPVMEDVMAHLALADATPSADLANLVDTVLPKTGSDAEVIVITSRELTDENAAALAALDRYQERVPSRRILTVSTAGEKLSEYFQL